jgi:hypothetical protein
MRVTFLILLVIIATPSCEPDDTPGGELTGIRLELVGKNPGPEGRYVLLVGESSALRASGQYDNGREETITLALFWTMQPEGPASIDCQKDGLTGNRVILEGTSAGTLEVTGHTREVEDSTIPCSPTPDGGWSFPDAGSKWPMESEPITVEVR